MAESHSSPLIDGAEQWIAAPRATTGGSGAGRFLLPELKRSLRACSRADILVSFLMESGVCLLLDELVGAVARGVSVRILTGTYMGVTQPEALYTLRREFGDRIDLRVCVNESMDTAALHAKSYIFHHPDGRSEVFVGSSNLSRSALTSGIEWNYRLDSTMDAASTQYFAQTFEDLFTRHSIPADDGWLASYASAWHMPPVLRDLQRVEDGEEPSPIFRPRGVQVEALYALERSRADGAEKGLIQAATGVGKTYLAAFDSNDFDRVLFVAHRNEILSQAARTFRTVRPADTTGFFDSREKNTQADLIFASAATLGRERYLSSEYFDRNAFDYVVVDEFHHAVTDQYRRITEYFRPKFLLGLTATPERMDGRNIYELCDYNVPYEISMHDAINRGILAPFHYYGIYDATNYDGVEYERGRYNQEALTDLYSRNTARTELVFRHYSKYAPKRTLAFCCSTAHAQDMAQTFRDRGIAAASVHSGAQGPVSMDRDKALHQLSTGELQVIFSVDMLNEGVDIPAVDMVMFLRPTESPVVFLQQLGRGLRKAPGKNWLTVLDFIGNYRMAERAPYLLAGESGSRHGGGGQVVNPEYPDECMVDFDLELLDLFASLQHRSATIRQRIDAEYFRVKELLGRRPSRMELFTNMDSGVFEECLRTPKHNPFRQYLAFLKTHGDLTAEEEALHDSIAWDFLAMLETTSMTRVYKMPVLYSLYNGGSLRNSVTDAEVLSAWKQFFAKDRNWKDLDQEMTREQYIAIPDTEHLKKIRRMPVHHLIASGDGIFRSSNNAIIELNPDLNEWLTSPALAAHMGDILEYRTMDYYRRRYRDSRPQRSAAAQYS